MGKFLDRLGHLVYSVFACIFLAGVAYVALRLSGFDLSFGERHISQYEASMNIAAAQRSLYFGYAWRAVAILVVLCGGLGAVYRFLYVPAVNDRERIYYDPATGMAPAIMRDVTPLKNKLQIALGNQQLERKMFRHDSNLAIAPTNYIRMNGSLTVDAQLENGVSVDQQVKHAGASWSVQNRVAGRSASGVSKNPNRAMLEADAGVYSKKAELLEMKIQNEINKPVGELPVVDVPVVLPELTLQQAIHNSMATPGRLVIGVSLDGSQHSDVDFTEEPFRLIGGKTRRGKTTTTAFQIVTAMLAWGWPVTVFEPSAKRDWAQGFAGYINHHVVDCENAVAHMKMIDAEYQRRSAILKANDMVNWQDDPSLCPPWVLVLEELGKLRDNLLALSKEELAKFDGILKSLLRAAANTGLMILAVDQYPDRYPTSMRGQFGKIAFYMGGTGLGNIMESPMNHRLVNERGVFDVGIQSMQGEPVFFRAFYTKPHLGELLASVPRVKPLALLVHDDCTANATKRPTNATNEYTNASPNERSYGVDSGNDTSTNATSVLVVEGEDGVSKSKIPPSLLRSFVRSFVAGEPELERVSAFSASLLDAFPNMSQADFRNELRTAVGACTNSPVGEMREYAFFLYHAFSPAGVPGKLEGKRPALYAASVEYWKTKGRDV